MDGKNSSGRRISLLNDNAESACQPARLPSISPSLRSRTSSYTSSPVNSPPTPQLVRSDSSDSTTMGTPSPITPAFAMDGYSVSQSMASPLFADPAFFPPQPQSHKDAHSSYPPMPQSVNSLPYHNTNQFSYPPQQQPESFHEARASSSAANPRSKKNSYPCPMAKQFNCSDFFTTSGHAARHAKKHTGKKDAFCPECNKAFTRKDNMEQHRRTHQSGRNAAKGTDNSIKKAKAQLKRPKPAPLQSSLPIPTLSSLTLDPSLPLSPATASMIAAPAVQPAESFNATYPDPTAYSMTPGYSFGGNGLDVLAVAASGEKRKFES